MDTKEKKFRFLISHVVLIINCLVILIVVVGNFVSYDFVSILQNSAEIDFESGNHSLAQRSEDETNFISLSTLLITVIANFIFFSYQHEKTNLIPDQIKREMKEQNAASRQIVPTEKTDVSAILAKINDYNKVVVFIGLNDPNLIDELQRQLDSCDNFEVYVNPRIMHLFASDSGQGITDKMISSPCSLECCTIFYSTPGDRMECDVIRRGKQNGRQVESYWITNVRRDDQQGGRAEFLSYMWDSYEAFYKKIDFEGSPMVRQHLASRMDALFHSTLAKIRLESDGRLTNRKYVIRNRMEQYSLASTLCAHAEKSILAIDSTVPLDWANDILMQRYLNANQSSSATDKRRVHIFSEEIVDSQKESYREFISKMQQAGFSDIRFIKDSDVSVSGFVLGSGVVIFDGEISFYIDRDKGGSDFAVDGLVQIGDADRLTNRFNLIFNSPRAMKASLFKKEMLK